MIVCKSNTDKQLRLWHANERDENRARMIVVGSEAHRALIASRRARYRREWLARSAAGLAPKWTHTAESKAKIGASKRGKDCRKRFCQHCGEWIQTAGNANAQSSVGVRDSCRRCYSHWKHGLRRARERFVRQGKRSADRPDGSWKQKMQRLALAANLAMKERSRPKQDQPRRIGTTWEEAFTFGVERLNHRTRYATVDPWRKKMTVLARCHRRKRHHVPDDVCAAS